LQLILANARRTPLQILGLCFPFPVAADIENGECAVCLPGEMVDADLTASKWIPPLARVSVAVAPGGRIAFRRQIAPSSHAVQDLISSRNKPITAALALAIFLRPDTAWHAGAATFAVGLDSGANLSRRLLKEGECLRDIATTQRLMRALFDLADGKPLSLAPHRYGFIDRCRLENALFDRFGLTPDLLGSLSTKFDRAA